MQSNRSALVMQQVLAYETNRAHEEQAILARAELQRHQKAEQGGGSPRRRMEGSSSREYTITQLKNLEAEATNEANIYFQQLIDMHKAVGPRFKKNASFAEAVGSNDIITIGDLDRSLNYMHVKAYAEGSLIAYRTSWKMFLYFCKYFNMLPTTYASTTAVAKALEKFTAFWGLHIKLAPSYLASSISGIKWTLRTLHVLIPEGEELRLMNKAMLGYKREWQVEYGPPPVSCRPTKRMVLEILELADEVIGDETTRQAVVAIIGMQVALSLRPGHLFYPGSVTKPHQIAKLQWLYQVGGEGATTPVSTYEDIEKWEALPQGIAIDTTCKNQKEEVTMSAPANRQRAAPEPIDLDAEGSELVADLEDKSPDDEEGLGAAYQILQKREDRDNYCFVTPMHTLLQKFPPFGGEHFLSGLPRLVQKNVPIQAKKLLSVYSKRKGVKNLTPKSFRSTVINEMLNNGYSKEQCQEQGLWSSRSTMERHYAAAAYLGSAQTSAVSNSLYGKNRRQLFEVRGQVPTLGKK